MIACPLESSGWRSPIDVAPGYLGYRPCPECGRIHRSHRSPRESAALFAILRPPTNTNGPEDI